MSVFYEYTCKQCERGTFFVGVGGGGYIHVTIAKHRKMCNEQSFEKNSCMYGTWMYRHTYKQMLYHSK